jgi:hypothetical protein
MAIPFPFFFYEQKTSFRGTRLQNKDNPYQRPDAAAFDDPYVYLHNLRITN